MTFFKFDALEVAQYPIEIGKMKKNWSGSRINLRIVIELLALSRCDVDIAITKISTVVILLKLHEIKMLIAKTLVSMHTYGGTGLHVN